RETWAPRSEQTDAKGEYSLVGLPSGNQPIQVRALGYALWNGSMDLQVGVQSTLDITLSKGCTLSGSVSDPDGKPIAKAKVLAFFEPLAEGYLQSGQIEYDGAFACPATYTDDMGRYKLPHVSDGQVYLYAQRPPVDPMDYTEIRLYAKAQMDLTEKTAATWNAVVSKGLSIEGHICYADNVPITGVAVLLEGGPDSETRVKRSADGSFFFHATRGQALHRSSTNVGSRAGSKGTGTHGRKTWKRASRHRGGLQLTQGNRARKWAATPHRCGPSHPRGAQHSTAQQGAQRSG
ncbi:MAG: carboxypeptidase regulatory-like domain-containing protein, partial [bacterium]|nr:carboxypeptidase regulatory-like domain-containing protein [bacterium]